ncbi:hypothetical protein TIFTF001_018741 [Ficus carica]|uniref:Uncharacterized protein n=1 Tax=Ficus carica TaxID=3494 RepID=A0AA88D9J8_FICCA|nr:hypothetical protein TIFTF001_018741 [Ficus carica]
MDNLENMFRGQEKLARQSTITSIMNSKQKTSTPVKNHMLMLMGFFAEAIENGAKLDYNTQIEMVFKTLSKDFVGFKAAYNLGNKELGLTELMRQMQAYELMINDGVLVQSKGGANLAVAASLGHFRNKKKKQKQ